MSTYCDFAPGHPLHGPYHDTEYGFPAEDESVLFERLVLEINQAGLSWLTVLQKRAAFRTAFAGFDVDRVAAFGQADIDRLLADAGIVRNRQKIVAAIESARAWVELRRSGVDFSDFLWSFTGGVPKLNRWKTVKQLPAESKESLAMSKALRERGFNFCGPTICYAFMQAVGMVNDHLVTCFRHSELSRSKVRP